MRNYRKSTQSTEDLKFESACNTVAWTKTTQLRTRLVVVIIFYSGRCQKILIGSSTSYIPEGKTCWCRLKYRSKPFMWTVTESNSSTSFNVTIRPLEEHNEKYKKFTICQLSYKCFKSRFLPAAEKFRPF